MQPPAQNLDETITIGCSIATLPPVDLNIRTTTTVKGPYTGAGATLVGGYKNWFFMADANYGKTWPDLLNNSINFTLFSLRTGLSGKIGDKYSIRSWIGAAYMDSKCTL